MYFVEGKQVSQEFEQLLKLELLIQLVFTTILGDMAKVFQHYHL